MQKIYVSFKKETCYRRSIHSTLLVVIGITAFVFVSIFTRNSYNRQREDLIEKLGKERTVCEMNEKLKVELAGITRGRYIELKAKERLGLKKPREEEVLVLRNE
ncbi:MAG: hypothetical protein LBQ00_09725 [Syntrophobacterales bacterium]|jgi:cell division protein FtsB|nr:hypothetical protein [Syntrophobacterales bacterium]